MQGALLGHEARFWCIMSLWCKASPVAGTIILLPFANL